MGAMIVAFREVVAMKGKTKQRGGERRSGLLLAFVAALFVVLLLVRLLAFVAGHGRHRF
jgi:hypothetical protein